MAEKRQQRVAVYHQHMEGGGAAQVTVRLIEALVAAGYHVELILNTATGRYLSRVPDGVPVVGLRRSSQEWARLHMIYAFRGDHDLLGRSLFVSRKKLDYLLYLPALARYLRRSRPDLIISNLWQLAIAAICARSVAGARCRVISIFHSSHFYQVARQSERSKRPRKWRRFFEYCSRVYSKADALVTVSGGIGRDLKAVLGLDPDKIQTIYNPISSGHLLDKAAQGVAHPWLTNGRAPVVLAVGRFSPEKNFRLLLDAFALVRAAEDARLIILGDGDGRRDLEARRDELGLTEYVDMPGWADNPYAFMQRAAVFVLSSRAEGLPTGLIEAMACGCPVVATDCPHGPREILAGGRYGVLVAVDDVLALAAAITQALNSPRDSDKVRRRAQDFSVASNTAHYLALLARLGSP